MGNQTGILDGDSGVYSPQSLFSDSNDLSDIESSPINSTPKINRINQTSFVKSTSVSIDLRSRLDSNGINSSSSEEEEHDNLEVDQAIDDRKDFTYSVSK